MFGEFRMRTTELKEGGQHRPILMKGLLNELIIRVEPYELPVLIMDGQSDDRGTVEMELKCKDTPACLGRTDVSGVHICLRLVILIGVLNVDRRPVMPFIDVFVEVFDRSDRRRNLDVDVAVILHTEIWIVWNDMSIRETETVLVIEHSIIPSTILRIIVFIDHGLFPEWFWITSCTLSIDHTRTFGIRLATRSMQHERDDGRM